MCQLKGDANAYSLPVRRLSGGLDPAEGGTKVIHIFKSYTFLTINKNHPDDSTIPKNGIPGSLRNAGSNSSRSGFRISLGD